MPIGAIKRGRDARGNPRGALHQHLVDQHATSLRESAKIAKQQGWSSGRVDDRGLRMVTAEDLFRRFQFSSLDVIGQPSAAWVQHGFSVGVGATVDIGSLVLPGFGVLEVSLNVAKERTDALFLLVTRQANLTETPSLRAAKPICLMALGGVCWKKSVSAGFAVGVKAGFTVDANKGFDHNIKSLEQVKREEAEEREKNKHKSFAEKLGDTSLEQIGIGLEASATLELGASYEGDILCLRDPSPTWHETPAAPSLVKGFESLIGKGDKAGIKARVQAFFTDRGQRHFTSLLHEQPWYQRAAKIITTKGRIPFENLETSLDEAAQHLEYIGQFVARPHAVEVMRKVRAAAIGIKELAAKKKTDKAAYEREKAVFKVSLDILFANELLFPFRPGRHFFGGNPSLEEYATALEIVGPIAELVLEERARKECTEEIAFHRQTIKAFKDYMREDARAPAPAAADDLASNLCKLDLWGHSPNVRAGIGAKISASAIAVLSAEVAAGVSAKKTWKFTNYRFQHFSEMAPPPRPPGDAKLVVVTQDTKLRYSQTVFSAEVSASAVGMTVSDDKTKVYNQMSYESATLRWIPGEATATPLKGSGFAFGQSVTLDGLLEALTEAKAGRMGALANIGNRIAVRAATLKDFLEHCWMIRDLEQEEATRRTETDKKKHFTLQVESDETSVVLIESTFAYTDTPITVDITNPKSPQLDKDMLDTMTDGAVSTKAHKLESIRLRYRRADAKDQSEGFTLGIPIKPVKIGIELKVVQRAGSSGIVDLDTRWYGERDGLNTNGGAGADEFTVPPVSIFHQ